MSPALAGGFLSTIPLGNSSSFFLMQIQGGSVVQRRLRVAMLVQSICVLKLDGSLSQGSDSAAWCLCDFGQVANLSELHFPIIKMGMIIMVGVGTYVCRGKVGLQSSWYSYHQATYHGLRQCGPEKRVTILQTTPS